MFKDPFAPKKRKRTLTSADKRRIAAKQNYKCKKCKRLLSVYHIDHIKEFSGGGSDRESNLQALCPNCHAEKTERDRHRKKQAKIRSKEREESRGFFGGFSLLGPAPKRRKSDSILENSILGTAPKKNIKKNKSKTFNFGI